MKNFKVLIMIMLIAMLTFLSCESDGGGESNGSDNVDVYTVSFDKQSGTGGTDSVTVVYGSVMPSALSPTRTNYIFIGYWDAISDGTQYYNADMTSARDWDKEENSILYARWAINKSTRSITGFTFQLSLVSTIIDENTHTIIVSVPWFTDLTSLTPVITHTGASITPASGDEIDLSTPQIYTVTSADGMIQSYTVTVTKKEYQLRERGPAGGWIFYINSSAMTDGWKYLEAAPADSEFVDRWDSAYNCCLTLNINGFEDWFLPGYDQLNLMYANLKQYGVGGFVVGYYWSSVNLTDGTSWRQSFNDGVQNTVYTNRLNRVRAIRAF